MKENASKSIRDQVEVVIRRRWFFVIPFCLALLFGIATSIMMPDEYEAVALVRMNETTAVGPLLKDSGLSGKPSSEAEILTQQIMSWPRLVELLEKTGGGAGLKDERQAEKAVAGLKKKISLQTQPSGIMRIAFTDPDPETAQRMVNTITRDLVAGGAELRRVRARESLEFITGQLKRYRQKLDSSQRSFLMHRLDADLRVANDRRRILADRTAKMRRSGVMDVKQDQSPVLARLQARLAELEVELSRLMIDARENHPRVALLKNEIEGVKNRIDAEVRRENIQENAGLYNPQLSQAEQELREAEMEISYLSQRRGELGGGADQPAVSDDEIAAMETGQKVDEDIYRMLLKQAESAYVTERLQDSGQGEIFSVLEYARLPGAPVESNRAKVLLAGVVVGIMLGIGSVFGVEYLDRSFRTANDARKALRMPYLGSISRMISEREHSFSFSFMQSLKNRLRKYVQRHRIFSEIHFVSPHVARPVLSTGIAPSVVIHHEPRCPVSEEYRILRTNIQSMLQEQPLNLLMLTSAVRGEGKSTTSANLAVALADAGRQTLLIDADMRKGVVHELFGLRQGPGLADILQKDIYADNVLQKTHIPNLSVMPSGQKPPNPAELLSGDRMSALQAGLRGRYDFVVVDAPPVLNLPDAGILGRNCDGIIMVVRAERTQREDVSHAAAMLAQARGNVVGFILTHVQYYIPKYVYNYLYGM